MPVLEWLKNRRYARMAEQIRQHDEEYRRRMKYWHVLTYVDGMHYGEASDHAHLDDMAVIDEHRAVRSQ